MTVDEELKTAQIALEDADRELRDAEKRRTQAEQQSQLIRGQLEQQRMEWQALTVRRKTLQDQLVEDGYDLHGVLDTLTAQANEKTPKKNLSGLLRVFKGSVRSTLRPSTSTSSSPSVSVIWMPRTPIWWRPSTPWKT